jgi:hypothetical protein
MPRVGGIGERRRRRLAGACALACAFLVASSAPAARIVAVGDVHGDIPAFAAVLRAAEVLDEDDVWRGGERWLVQVGDLLDRGPQMRSALDFAMSLEAQAEAAGGRYVQMLGNHEVMNLVGDLRYVVAENFAEFADPDSEKRRESAWHDYRDWQRRRARRLGLRKPELGAAARDQWLALHPPGWLEHRAAFSAEGAYGRWLRGRPSLLVVDRTLFVHGGLAPSIAGQSAAEIDARVHEEIRRFDELRGELAELDVVLPFFDLPEIILAARDELAGLERAAKASPGAAAEVRRRRRLEEMLAWDTWSIHSQEGPLWFRGFSHWSDEEVAERLPPLLAAFDVDRFVVGHTPQANGLVRMRLDGALFLVDTGMLTSYVEGGRGSALVIEDGAVVRAVYPGEPPTTLWSAPAAAAVVASTSPFAAAASLAPADEGVADRATPTTIAAAPAPRRFLGPDGEPLPFADDDALLEFLASAPVVEVKEIGEGITRPRRLTLERDGVRVRGLFQTVHEQRRVAHVAPGRREANFRDFHGFEPAAYRLGRLLGLTNIPPSTSRRFDGDSGSIQLWIEKATSEKERAKAGTAHPDLLRWKRELQVQLVWDALVGNTDRNQGNFLYGPDWRLWMIDHSRAFRTSGDLVAADKIIWCERRLFERLREVSDDEIRAAVDEPLRANEVRALLARRKKVVAHLEELVRAKGEATVLFEWPR